MAVSTDHDRSQKTVVDRLLDSLDELVWRHRSLALRGDQYAGMHTELIAAEVAHELAMARSALNQQRRLRRVR
jgi:hypothetical protein